jgi:Mg-chelatase subunit ChlD
MTKEELAKYDYILVLDKSGSMGERDMPGNKSRWEAAQEATLALARKCAEFDADGITIVPFAGSFKSYPNVVGSDVQLKQIFTENEPNGGTDLTKVLTHVFDTYFANPAKPIIVLVVTDGEPTDPSSVAKLIVNTTKKMNTDDQIGVQFIQIGSDAGATRFLKSLDDDLVSQGAKFDIVDTKTTDEMENMTISEVLMAALED